jgi:LytS/YehU family sensor histidine kinase
MKVVSSYLFLLETRFQKALQVNIQLSEQAKQKFIPPVSIQLLIENSVKHNVISKDKILQIFIYDSEDALVVRNNLQKKNDVEESTGLGLSNIRKRYSLLSEKNILVVQTSEFFTVQLPLLEIHTIL